MAKGFGLVARVLAIGIVSGCVGNNDTQTHLLHTQYGSFDPASDTMPELNQALTQSKDSRVAKIVQFAGHIQPAWRDAVRANGLQVRGYLPEDSLIVVGTPAQAQALTSLSFVRAVVDQPRLFKIDRRLVRMSARGARLLSLRPTEELIVEMATPAARPAIERIVRAEGGVVTGRIGPVAYAPQKILRITMPIAGVAALAAHPDVLAVEMYFAPKLLNDRSFGVVQDGVAQKSTVWDHAIRGANQIVAVADTGLFAESCFFNTGNKVAGYEDIAGNGDGDGHGHGTHVAGSIAGDNFGNGVYDPHDGMAPAAQLFIQDVADGADLVGLSDDLNPLFASAYAAGARIHSDSWGDEDNSYSAIARSVDTFVNEHPDFLVLFANGNSGDYGEMTVGSPATSKNIISVGAVNGGSPEDVAWFSSKGPTLDGRIKPTLSAPGMGVVSAKNSGACATRSMSGTSMATPTLAGAAALVREYFTDGFYPGGVANANNAIVPSAALLKAVMLAGADDMGGSETGGHFPATGQGFGRAHLANALVFAGESHRLWIQDNAIGLETGAVADYEISVAEGRNVRVALTWSDPAAAPGAEKALVNDLDLVLSGPEGTYHGNIFEDGRSALREGTDQLNVEEIVSLSSVKPGIYRISVHGTNIPMGPQAYALAIVSN